MERIFAYIWTTNKDIITKLDINIKQVKYYITVYNFGNRFPFDPNAV